MILIFHENFTSVTSRKTFPITTTTLFPGCAILSLLFSVWWGPPQLLKFRETTQFMPPLLCQAWQSHAGGHLNRSLEGTDLMLDLLSPLS